MIKSLRNVLAGLAAAALLALGAVPSVAQTYPYSSPVYNPSAVLPTTTYTTTGDYYFVANGVAGATVRVSSLTGTLVATVQGSNDPVSVANASANWTTLYYLDLSNPATAPANSISANGFYGFGTAGLTRFRVHVATLSGGGATVKIQASATVGTNFLYSLNPSSAQALPAGTNVIGTVNYSSDYPAGATPLTASATGTTAATTATLAGTTGKTTYVCGFSIMSSATAAVVVAPTVTGVITGTLTMSQYVPANTAGVGELKRDFAHCIPASATNTGIAVVSGAASTGGVTAVNAWGYQL